MKCCYVSSLFTDDYLWGAIGFDYSLKKVGAKYPHYVMCTDNLSKETFNTLESAGVNYRIFKNVCFSNTIEKYKVTLNRFHMFDFKDFDKVLSIDTDMVMQKNIDEVFDFPTPGGFLLNDRTFLSGQFLLVDPKTHNFEEFCDQFPCAWADEECLNSIFNPYKETMTNFEDDYDQKALWHDLIAGSKLKYWNRLNISNLEQLKECIDNRQYENFSGVMEIYSDLRNTSENSYITVAYDDSDIDKVCALYSELDRWEFENRFIVLFNDTITESELQKIDKYRIQKQPFSNLNQISKMGIKKLCYINLNSIIKCDFDGIFGLDQLAAQCNYENNCIELAIFPVDYLDKFVKEKFSLEILSGLNFVDLNTYKIAQVEFFECNPITEMSKDELIRFVLMKILDYNEIIDYIDHLNKT